jgi:hypothetical protein
MLISGLATYSEMRQRTELANKYDILKSKMCQRKELVTNM